MPTFEFVCSHKNFHSSRINVIDFFFCLYKRQMNSSKVLNTLFLSEEHAPNFIKASWYRRQFFGIRDFFSFSIQCGIVVTDYNPSVVTDLSPRGSRAKIWLLMVLMFHIAEKR